MNLLHSDINELNTILNCENINLIVDDNFLDVNVYYYNIHIMTLDLDVSKAFLCKSYWFY